MFCATRILQHTWNIVWMKLTCRCSNKFYIKDHAIVIHSHWTRQCQTCGTSCLSNSLSPTSAFMRVCMTVPTITYAFVDPLTPAFWCVNLPNIWYFNTTRYCTYAIFVCDVLINQSINILFLNYYRKCHTA